MKKEKPFLILNRFQIIKLYIGIGLVILFSVIYLITAIIKGNLGYISFFFNNIGSNIALTILTSIHVGILGTGILIILISFFYITPTIYCYKDRFEIIIFLQEKKIIYFDKIKDINGKVYLTDDLNLFKHTKNKEYRIYLNNPVYNFYFYYYVQGYFDDIVEEKKENNNLKKCYVSKEDLTKILELIKQKNKINFSLLYEEYLNQKG